MKYCATCKTVYPADFQCCPKDGSALSSSSELLPGMVIRDKYQILQQIGAGGMATVYQVRHLAFNEIKAIKLINSQLADGDQFSKRLRSEAVIARKLQHPNAVHVEDLDRTEDGRPFIVMEYVEGQNLRAVIRQNGPLPTLRALRIAAQVASALAAAHKLGIIHRDIKPDNIHLISQPDGTDFVKVLDFGIAKFTQDMSSSAPRTGSGLVVGTPQYVSPEQAMGRHGGELDGRSDLYTLGIVLYEMLTGRLPFDSDTPVGLLVHHLHTAPVPPDELRPDLAIPHAVSEVLMKALEKNPEQRFRNADEMLIAINSVEEQVRHPQQTRTLPAAREEEPQWNIRTAVDETSAPPTVEELVLEKPGTEESLVEAPLVMEEPVFEEQLERLLETPTDVPDPEAVSDTPKPPITGQMPPASHDRATEPASSEDVAVPLLEPPAPPMHPMWPREAPRERDVREELLAAAYPPQPSRRMLYSGMAAFAVVCVAVLGIYLWPSSSPKPMGPASEVHDQSPASAGASTRPAAETAGGVHDSATPRPAAIAPSASTQGANLSASPAPMGEPEKLAKIKELLSQGRALSDRGEYLAAIAMFDSVLKMDPQNVEAKSGRRRAKERMQLEEALPDEAK